MILVLKLFLFIALPTPTDMHDTFSITTLRIKQYPTLAIPILMLGAYTSNIDSSVHVHVDIGFSVLRAYN